LRERAQERVGRAYCKVCKWGIRLKGEIEGIVGGELRSEGNITMVRTGELRIS
jgi:hypothetical protein